MVLISVELRILKTSEELKDQNIKKKDAMVTLYSANYLKRPYLAKYRAPSLYAFYKRNVGNCKGWLTNLFLNEGTVQSQLTLCTNSSHIL